MNVYTDESGYVYAAPDKRHHSHQKRTAVADLAEARAFVQAEFDVLVAHYDEWLVREGHPGAEE